MLYYDNPSNESFLHRWLHLPNIGAGRFKANLEKRYSERPLPQTARIIDRRSGIL